MTEYLVRFLVGGAVVKPKNRRPVRGSAVGGAGDPRHRDLPAQSILCGLSEPLNDGWRDRADHLQRCRLPTIDQGTHAGTAGDDGVDRGVANRCFRPMVHRGNAGMSTPIRISAVLAAGRSLVRIRDPFRARRSRDGLHGHYQQSLRGFRRGPLPGLAGDLLRQRDAHRKARNSTQARSGSQRRTARAGSRSTRRRRCRPRCPCNARLESNDEQQYNTRHPWSESTAVYAHCPLIDVRRFGREHLKRNVQK
ncbi:hypothetical protein ABIE49_002563 [Bradyrhizobium sp. OAE829]